MNGSPSNQPPRGRKPVIGLLGAPGSGKSLVAQQLAELGCAVIDADVLAKQALDEPGVREQLRSWWGDAAFDREGRVDRRAVGRIVFADPHELARLESVTHPWVNARRAELRRQHQADPAVVAIVDDTPLLLEKNLEGDCDVLVYVDAPQAVRLERVQRTRGWTAAELDRREKNQVPLDIKRERADYVVNNYADASETFNQVRRVLSRIITS